MIRCNNYYDVVDKLNNTKLSNACKFEPTTEVQSLMFRHMRKTFIQAQLVARQHSLSVVRAIGHLIYVRADKTDFDNLTKRHLPF